MIGMSLIPEGRTLSGGYSSEVNVSVGSTVVNLLVPALNRAENAAQWLKPYTGGKHARNVRYALRNSVK